MSSRILCVSQDGLKEAAHALIAGKLVAFPTETVYGLGANALNVTAVSSIFAAKGRPKTDPLIVHVYATQQAEQLVELDEKSLSVFRFLGERFWPGPLTIVAKARSIVPDLVTSGTGFVGVRCPAHPVARDLIQLSNLPIAAPSANKFGHVSPTKAQHVFDDLKNENVLILDGGACTHGIESTVLKLSSNLDGICQLSLLRKGATAEENLIQAIKEAASQLPPVEFCSTVSGPKHVVVEEEEPQIAPGQMLRHYAPDVPAFVLKPESSSSSGSSSSSIDSKILRSRLSSTVLLDFGKRAVQYKNDVLAYRDLSEEASSSEAARHLFDSLRWAESVENAECILFPDLEKFEETGLGNGVSDRLYRASVGKAAFIQNGQVFESK